jgi:hypothetical protein
MRALLTALILLSVLPAFAADRTGMDVVDPPIVLGPGSPHRNEQAQAVASSRECWRSCQMSCKAEFLACGYEQSGAECLHLTDRCDRACQRSCRSTWNPLLDWPRPWD